MTKARDLSQTPNASLGFKNRIINGAMMIDQRNAGASVTPANAQFTLDRYWWQLSQASKLTNQQSTVAPNGFNNSFLVTSSSSYSVLTGDYFAFGQKIEGFNTADLGWGTASASAVTLSFWVRSSLTGTFGGSVINGAFNRSYPYSYTISSANTWEYKTITIAGDTTGTWVGATNGTGLQVWFGLGVGATYSGTAGAWTGSGLFSATGATSVVGTSGATFYITGVQLEVGSSATGYEYRQYGQELALCQRYYWKMNANSGGAETAQGFQVGTTLIDYIVSSPTPMRSLPTCLPSGWSWSTNPVTGNIIGSYDPTGGAFLTSTHSSIVSTAVAGTSNASSFLLRLTGSGGSFGGAGGRGSQLTLGTTANFGFSSEL